MNLVITLIHDTRAGKAEWVAEGSRLRTTVTQAVKTELPSASIVFESFRWSGGNSPRSRLTAAAELQRHLRAVVSKYRGWEHLLVTHGHGGNVALYALRDSEAARSVHGLACFSTPFLYARPRDLGPLGGVILFLALFVLWAGLLTLLALRLAEHNDVRAALILGGTGLVFLLASFSYNSLLTLARDREVRLAVNRVPVPLFLARIPDDDASAMVAVSSFASWTLTGTWRLVGAPACVLGAIGPLVRRLGIRRSDLATAIGFLLGVALLPYCLLIGLIGASLGLVTALLSGLALTLFGLGYGATSLVLEITAEACPVGNWMVHVFPSRDRWEHLELSDPSGAAAADPPGLSRSAQSSSCEHPGALRALAEWILTALRTGTDRDVAGRENRSPEPLEPPVG